MEYMSYATPHAVSAGRYYDEPDQRIRTPFQRDRDRVIHSRAFRRLQYKTQVFVYHEGDHFRNRLTHTIEVAQVARSLAYALNLNGDLTETIALAHDFGHPPFGHAGERVLNECMADHGGFNHNIHALKIVTQLEQRYARFDGLNLTAETLEGIIKHNGPIALSALPDFMRDYTTRLPLYLEKQPHLEAQVAGLSDDIAYICHDMEDGLRAELLSIDDLRDLPVLGKEIEEAQSLYPTISSARIVTEALRKFLHFLVEDLRLQTLKNIAHFNVATVADIRNARQPMVVFSEEVDGIVQQVKTMLRHHVYRHPKVVAKTDQAQLILKQLFERYMSDIKYLPAEWQARIGSHASAHEVVSDYIACMTDRFAMHDHDTLYDLAKDRL